MYLRVRGSSSACHRRHGLPTVDQLIPDLLACLWVGKPRRFRVPYHVTLLHFHDVEVTAEDVMVLAGGHGRGDANRSVLQGVDDAMFPQHIVGGLSYLARWRTADNQIGVAPGDKQRLVRVAGLW